MNENDYLDQPEQEEKLGIGWIILSFLIPLAGAIIYFINMNKAPGKAKTACYAALAGFGLGIVLNAVTAFAGF